MVDGSETKSQAINSKSSCTESTPSSVLSTEPRPLDEIPTFTPALKSSFNIFPAGVFNTSTVPYKSSLLHLRSVIK